MHIHTTDSDGTKPLDEVIAIGRKVGLEFMMFSDHMKLKAREEGREGFHGKTLVAIGYEHNDQNDHHHYLLFDSPRVYPSDWSPAQYVAAGAEDGALGIVAHPDEIRDALKEHPAYPWTDWSADQFTGLEIWNQMSEWMEKLTRFNKLTMAFSPRKSMVGPTERIRRRWDELNMQRKVVGIAGADAHAFRIKVGPLTVEVFPYKVHFRSLRCYVLFPQKMSAEPKTARKQLYDAIRDCHLFFANVRWGDAEKFEFWAENDHGKAIAGESLALSGVTLLRVKLPSTADLRVIHNGDIILSTETKQLEYCVQKPGIYRVEAYKGKRGWIYSNHIRVGL
jgi:hypothetical protein